MTAEEASELGASAYPAPCIDPTFFEGRHGPRQGAARIPPERYKLDEKELSRAARAAHFSSSV